MPAELARLALHRRVLLAAIVVLARVLRLAGIGDRVTPGADHKPGAPLRILAEPSSVSLHSHGRRWT